MAVLLLMVILACAAHQGRLREQICRRTLKKEIDETSLKADTSSAVEMRDGLHAPNSLPAVHGTILQPHKILIDI
jgi:hypothetical protein